MRFVRLIPALLATLLLGMFPVRGLDAAGEVNRLYQIEPGNKAVSVGLVPTSTTVPAGGALEISGSLRNHRSEVQTVSL